MSSPRLESREKEEEPKPVEEQAGAGDNNDTNEEVRDR
jgi:hypothetical protein